MSEFCACIFFRGFGLPKNIMSLHTSVLVRRADHGYFRFLRHHSFIVNPEVLQTMNKRAKNKLNYRSLASPSYNS